MKPTNLEGVGSHAQAIIRGWIDQGLTFRSGTTTAIDVRDLNVIGGTLTPNADGSWTLTIGGAGGTPGSGGTSTASAPVNMLNNAGRDLLPGDVVVTDDSADTAVTVTTNAASVLIAGVVQEPIAAGRIGPVLFSGYAPIVNAPGAVRGEYAQTSTTETQAGSTSGREAGSFAVYLTGADLPDFASSAVVTRQPGPVETLTINMPASIPVGRALFLALWLVDGVTGVDIPGWTRIGAETGFNYYYRVSSGSDAATATWTGVSTAIAAVLLLHPSVSLAAPVADHDYEDTTAAAALSGLDTAVAHYALAGVATDVATPGSGFVRLAGGSAGTVSAGTPTLVQSKFTDAHNGTDPSTTFDSTLTADNLMLAIPFMGGSDTWTTDPRLGIPSCGIDTAMTKFGKANTNYYGSSGINVVSMLGKNVDAGDTYSGPFGTNALCLEPITASLLLMEFSGISLASYDVLSSEGFDASPVNLGTFSGVGANDLLIMALVKKRDGYGGSPDPAVDTTGWTQIVDGYYLVNGWAWVGYKVGDGAASVSYTSDGFGGWGAMAVLIRQGAAFAEGTLSGKYIGHDAAITSPFSGAGKEDDAIFAIPLLLDAKPAALVYGPDLGGSTGGGFSGVAEDLTTAETDTTLVLHPDGAGNVVWGVGSGAAPAFDHGNMGATETVDLADGTWHRGTLNAACTITVSGFTVDEGLVAVVEIEGNGFAIAWDVDTTFIGDDQPSATGVTVFLLFSSAGDSLIYGAKVGGGLSVTDFATPAIVLGTAAAAGSADTVIRSDSTIVAFDATVPAAIGTAATGSQAKAARRDHVHATGAGTPSTQAFGDAAATGSGPAAAMTDHKHGMPAAPTVTVASVRDVGGHWEVLMDPATSSPPVPLTTPDGTDWVYGWLSD